MAVVEYSPKEMNKHIQLSVDEIIENLSNIGAPSEFDRENNLIISEVTPNRPDWYSVEGLARSLKSYKYKKNNKYSAKKSNFKVTVDESVSKIRPYTVCVVVKGLKFDEQKVKDIIQLQEKLMSTLGRKVKKFGIGFYPLDNISFPLQYTTKKPDEINYIPLGHENEMSANEILEKHKKGIQYGHFIKNNQRYPVYIDAKNKIMCLIPIVNSAETGKIDEQTKDVFVEVTGMDFGSVSGALNIITCSLIDMGGVAHQVELDYGKKKISSPNLELQEIKINSKEAGKILGISISEHNLKDYLAKMGFDYKSGKVIVPPYRVDIIDKVDIIEDIAIAYGYNNFELTMPDFFSAGKVDRSSEKYDKVFLGMGFSEIKTFILTNKKKIENINSTEKVTEILNPSNEEYTVIRPTIIQEVLEVLSINKTKGLPQKIYEIGIVQKQKTEKKLVFAIMDKQLEFSSVRGYIQTLSYEVNADYRLEKEDSNLFEEKTSCKITSKGKKIGVFGQVRKEILNKFGLGFDVYIGEVEL